MLSSYLKRQYKILVMLLVFCGIFATVFFLYDLPLEAVVYAAVLCLCTAVILFLIGFNRFICRHLELTHLLKCIHNTVLELPPPHGLLEADYQAILHAVCSDRAQLAVENQNRYQDMTDYYTLWAHQIKTPIAAMHLLLQAEGKEGSQLAAELLKIEQYVEMVLSYLRLGSETTDYVLRQYTLDNIVRSAIRKYARLFILKKISLDFQETGRTVVTDEKWLSFILEQLLSNAIKYTPEGGHIRIFSEGKALSLSDTGIGIRSEDLPRVFEKGFTGYNGRQEKKSTGIGLYLCRQIVDRLGHQIEISSTPGSGTLVRLILPDVSGSFE